LTSTSSSYAQIADSAATTASVADLCGARTYSITDSSGNALTDNWVTVSGTTSFTITAAPATDNMYTTPNYSLKLHIVLASYTSITADISFTVTVSRYTCTASTTYTASGTIDATKSYTIGATAVKFNAPTYTTTPYTCAESVTYSITKQDGTAAPSFVTID